MTCVSFSHSLLTISADHRCSLVVLLINRTENTMSYILLLLLSVFIANISTESSSEIDRVKERLQNSANQLTITELSNPPRPASYLNSQLTKNAPHQIDLTSELTSIIPEWNPRVFALDPACPYYFSKVNEDDLNLLSYLHAIESNETVSSPFVNVLPRSYRSAFPLLSIFRCRELVQSSSSPFFHNIELILAPGKTELPINQLSTEFSQFFCSLYGSPHFLLINQTKSPSTIYNTPALLSQENLADIDFLLTSLTPGTCLFVPSGWVIGAQLNNSISLVFTLKTIASPPDGEFLRCTKIDPITLDEVQFTIGDQFNISGLSLIAYFYPHLNPPMFDREFTSETFLRYFQADKNVSQLIMKWTPELIDLIQNKLFQQLDVNDDELFSIGDYFDIKQSNLKALEQSISTILEEIRRTVHAQYNELAEMMKKITQQSGTDGLDYEDKETLVAMLENLPESVKKNLGRNNINVGDVLDKIRSMKSKQSSNKKQPEKEDEEFDRTDL